MAKTIKKSMIKQLAAGLILTIYGLFASEYVFARNNTNKNSNGSQSNGSQDYIGNMLMQSMSLIGIAYRWGGNTPETGMDCSGFVRYVFRNSLGVDLPRTSAEMARIGKRIDINEIKPGDLIFFNTKRGASTHLGIYLGNNQFIEAPSKNKSIRITEFAGYYRRNFNGAKRIVHEDTDSRGNTNLVSLSHIRNEALPSRSVRRPVKSSRVRRKPVVQKSSAQRTRAQRTRARKPAAGRTAVARKPATRKAVAKKSTTRRPVARRSATTNAAKKPVTARAQVVRSTAKKSSN